MEHRIGEVISSARQNAHLTQEEFAARLGVTPQAVSKWERGQGLPDITMVEGICRILRIDADELLGIMPKTPATERGDATAQKEIQAHMLADPMLLEIGAGLIPAVTEGISTGALDTARKKLVVETGCLIPLVRIRDNADLEEREFRIVVYDKVVYEKEELPDDGNVYQTMVDALARACREHYAEILNKQIVKCMVDTAKELYPGVADGVYPEQISYLELEYLLRELFLQKKSLHNLIRILEYAEWEMLHRGNRNIPEAAAIIADKL